jgi:serine O-acetyltransferase
MFREVEERVETIHREDPRVRSILEILRCYQGFHDTLMHRFANRLYRWRL